MKKAIIISILSCFLLLEVHAQSEPSGIKFFQGTVKETLAKAQQENKLVFVDCYTSWCGPCKWMEKNVFTNDTAARFYNETFVNYKLDMEKGEGIDFRKKYEVSSFPTYLFIDASGKLVHKATSRMSTMEFVSVAKKALNPKETSTAIEQKYLEGDRSPELLFKYIAILKNSNRDKAQTVYEEFIGLTTDKDLLTDKGWQLIKLYPLDEQSRLFKFLKANEAHFVAKYGSAEVKEIQTIAFVRALNGAIYGNNKEEFFRRLAIYRQDKSAKTQADAAEMELRYYIRNKDYDSFLKMARQYSQTVLKTDEFKLSFIARHCSSSTENKEVLQQACIMAKQAVDLNGKEFSNYSTYAELCFKLGNKEEALKAAQISLEVLGDENPKAQKRVEELIGKIKVM
ncbi:thioredoxin family protein [Solitalea sp. MAHUQ-68]|uniref:Thioredoxin family protein n=1 Tax=Solitalea agri TaxID=2953739 RepID=A0A9X2F4M4_9SPHI|nr:thioredoxin family protein [Solitalea agri]MCO4294216.1 thioredoxin family protein [Solitalea agri]